MKRWTYKDFVFKIHGEEHIHGVWCLDVEDNIELIEVAGVVRSPRNPSDSVIHWKYASGLVVNLLYAWLYLLTVKGYG